MSNLRHIVSTRVSLEGMITQELRLDDGGKLNDLRDMTLRWVINAQDEGVRAALIRLGWTPPPPGFKPPESNG